MHAKMGSGRRRTMFKRLARLRNDVTGRLWSWAESGSILLGFAWLLLRARTDVSPPLPRRLSSDEKRPDPVATAEGGVRSGADRSHGDHADRPVL